MSPNVYLSENGELSRIGTRDPNSFTVFFFNLTSNVFFIIPVNSNLDVFMLRQNKYAKMFFSVA